MTIRRANLDSRTGVSLDDARDPELVEGSPVYQQLDRRPACLFGIQIHQTGGTPVPLFSKLRLGKFFSLAGLTLLLVGHGSAQTSTTFVVGSYNIENWNSIERQGTLNQPKPQAEKDAVLNVIASVHPDVLGLEEIGTPDDLAELRAGLTGKGVVYPFVEYLQGADRDRRVCLLSRFPIAERHSRTDYTYRLNDQVTPIGRGILDVVVQVNNRYSFRAIVVHLKSKRTIELGDQAVMRLEEAKLLRVHLNGIFKSNPATKLLALGDFNDTPETLPIKTVIGEPPFALFALPCQTGKGYTGTHLWRFHSDWSRLDYLLASPSLSNDFVTGSAHIYEGPAAGVASDHRLIYAGFTAPAVVIAPVATNPIRRLIFTGSLMGVVMVAGVVAIVVARHRLLDPES